MKWPVDIIEKIAKRKVVLFLGAGVSANAISEKGDKRPPTWEQFLNKGISEVTDENIVEYVIKLLNEKDYLITRIKRPLEKKIISNYLKQKKGCK